MSESIDLNDVLTLEDTRLKEVNSIETYIIELNYFRQLIADHIGRCKSWQKKEVEREAFGKLNDFLIALESDR
jgi:hypothetical protein